MSDQPTTRRDFLATSTTAVGGVLAATIPAVHAAGGDVLRIGKTIFVGNSQRTNAEGINQLAAELSPFGYSVHGVPVDRCLHLKSACSYLGAQAVLANPDWVETGFFELEGLRVVEVPTQEPHAANVLAIGETVIVAAAFPETAAIIAELGFTVLTLDISELMKAEAGTEKAADHDKA